MRNRLQSSYSFYGGVICTTTTKPSLRVRGLGSGTGTIVDSCCEVSGCAGSRNFTPNFFSDRGLNLGPGRLMEANVITRLPHTASTCTLIRTNSVPHSGTVQSNSEAFSLCSQSLTTRGDHLSRCPSRIEDFLRLAFFPFLSPFPSFS